MCALLDETKLVTLGINEKTYTGIYLDEKCRKLQIGDTTPTYIETWYYHVVSVFTGNNNR